MFSKIPSEKEYKDFLKAAKKVLKDKKDKDKDKVHFPKSRVGKSTPTNPSEHVYESPI